ncbi:MAG: response regulator [Leptospiraceae bacterium]|nr:response regulator [Leptospiraceae bacterium]
MHYFFKSIWSIRLLSLLLFVFCFFGSEFVFKLQSEADQEKIQKEIFYTASEFRVKIETELNSQIHLTSGLISYILASKGVVNKELINEMLEVIYKQGKYVRNIGLAPNNIIRYLYPLRGNEKALGLNYEKQADQWPDIEDMIRLRQARIIGPIHLIQGGRAFIYRIPVFLKDSTYWGILSIVINYDILKFEELKKKVNNKANLGLMVNGKIMYGKHEFFRNESIILPLQLSNIQLLFAFQLKEEWKKPSFFSKILRLVGIIISFALTILFFLLSKENIARKESELKAEKANKAKSEFLANMSHEIRTPINAILGFSQIISKDNFSSEQLEYIHKIQIASSTLLQLVNDILDISKIEEAKMQLNKEKVSIYTIIYEVSVLNETKARNKKLSFSMSFDDEIRLYFFLIDSLRLKQVLLNIVGNAIKFTERGEVRIIVKFQKLDEKSCILNFFVSDSGIGIEQKQQEKLFQAFVQAENSTTKKYGGTGLGLVISKKLVNMMGGDIVVDSIQGIGSTFSFYIPTEFYIQESNSMIVKNEKVKLLENCKEQNILLVEDNEINQLIAKKILLSMGFNVSLASNGEEAIQELNENINLVLMDIQMPVMDGIEATKQIRKLDKYINLPIIALTANVTQDSIQECLLAGMNSHIFKPFTKEELLEVISSYICK